MPPHGFATGRFRWFPPKTATVNAAARAALLGAAEVILEEANRTVPFEEGNLEATGVVDADDKAATISYDTPYAVRQHEEMNYRHAPGRRAKWLQLAMQENAPRVLEWMATKMREAFR